MSAGLTSLRAPRWLSLGLALCACGATRTPPPRATEVPGARVVELCLAAPWASPEMELSALAWHRGDLVLLPQWPRARAGGRPSLTLLRVPRERLEAWLDGRDRTPLTPREVRFEVGEITQLPGFEGFEALAVDGDRAAVAIEGKVDGEMRAWLATGTFDAEGGLLLDGRRVAVPVPVRSDNHAYEALTRGPSGWLAIFEAGGADPRCGAPAFSWSEAGEPRAVAFPALPYRLTDATSLDAEGRFWMTQYSYREEGRLCECERTIRASRCFSEPVACDPARGAARSVERLVELRLSGEGVTPTGRSVALSTGDRGRNWEGLARLGDRGWLVVTDQFPRTIMGFVPAPGQRAPTDGACPGS